MVEEEGKEGGTRRVPWEKHIEFAHARKFNVGGWPPQKRMSEVEVHDLRILSARSLGNPSELRGYHAV